MADWLDRALATGSRRLGGDGRLLAAATAAAVACAALACARDVADGIGYAAQLGGVIGTFGWRILGDGRAQVHASAPPAVRAGVPCGIAAVLLCVAEQATRPSHPDLALVGACVGAALAAWSVLALAAGLRGRRAPVVHR